MRIGELAAATGTTPRALRHYEQEGLIGSTREANGYRDYDERAAVRVRNIRYLLDTGLTLADVRCFAGCLDGDMTTAPRPPRAWPSPGTASPGSTPAWPPRQRPATAWPKPWKRPRPRRPVHPSPHQRTPVHRQNRARDERGVRGGELQHRCRHLLRAPQAAQRRAVDLPGADGRQALR